MRADRIHCYFCMFGYAGIVMAVLTSLARGPDFDYANLSPS